MVEGRDEVSVKQLNAEARMAELCQPAKVI